MMIKVSVTCCEFLTGWETVFSRINAPWSWWRSAVSEYRLEDDIFYSSGMLCNSTKFHFYFHFRRCIISTGGWAVKWSVKPNMTYWHKLSCYTLYKFCCDDTNLTLAHWVVNFWNSSKFIVAMWVYLCWLARFTFLYRHLYSYYRCM